MAIRQQNSEFDCLFETARFEDGTQDACSNRLRYRDLDNAHVGRRMGPKQGGTRVIVLSGRNTVTSQLRPAHKPRAMRLLEQTSPSPGVGRISPEGPKGSQILPSGPLELPL